MNEKTASGMCGVTIPSRGISFRGEWVGVSPFIGPPLEEGESVQLTINLTRETSEEPALEESSTEPVTEEAEAGPEKTPTEEIAQVSLTVHQDKVGATSLKISSSELQNLLPGKATMQWVRSWNGTLQDATPTGGTISGSYISLEREVTVE